MKEVHKNQSTEGWYKGKKYKVNVMCRKFECRKDIHYKTQPGPVAKNATPRPSGWESNPLTLDY